MRKQEKTISLRRLDWKKIAEDKTEFDETEFVRADIVLKL